MFTTISRLANGNHATSQHQTHTNFTLPRCPTAPGCCCLACISLPNNHNILQGRSAHQTAIYIRTHHPGQNHLVNHRQPHYNTATPSSKGAWMSPTAPPATINCPADRDLPTCRAALLPTHMSIVRAWLRALHQRSATKAISAIRNNPTPTMRSCCPCLT